MPKLPSNLLTLFQRGQQDPAFFVESVVGMTTLWEKQKEIMYSVRDNARTCVRSSNGVGKTFTTANTVTWFLTTHPNSIVVSTAPTSRQVKELLWQEINNIHANSKYPLGGRCLNVSWTLGAKWFAIGMSTDDPNRFQGFHADNILGVIDEAAGVDAPIWEGMDAILTSSGARLLVIGNPTEPSGRFYDAFSSPLYNKLHISAFDTPNFTENGIILDDLKTGAWEKKFKTMVYPALITPKWASERLQEWGEDSPAFQSRVLGNFPTMGDDTMIPLGWVMRATERPLVHEKKDRCFMAIDVARFGADESVIGIRRGNSFVRKEVLHNVDVHALSKFATRVADEEQPEFIKVDVVGIGSGVADNLRAWGYKAIDYVAQERAWSPEKFVNKRTESWYLLRERFRKNTINIENDEMLVGQLSSPKYTFDTAGRYKLESKDDMKKRGLESPDRADVVAMLFESDEDFGTSIAKDYEEDKVKPGTVGALLRELSRGEEEEIQWHTMKF
jgi:phage terminase large subunit